MVYSWEYSLRPGVYLLNLFNVFVKKLVLLIYLIIILLFTAIGGFLTYKLTCTNSCIDATIIPLKEKMPDPEKGYGLFQGDTITYPNGQVVLIDNVFSSHLGIPVKYKALVFQDGVYTQLGEVKEGEIQDYKKPAVPDIKLPKLARSGGMNRLFSGQQTGVLFLSVTFENFYETKSFLYRSLDNGKTWQSIIQSGTNNSAISDDRIMGIASVSPDDKTVYIFTELRKVYKILINDKNQANTSVIKTDSAHQSGTSVIPDASNLPTLFVINGSGDYNSQTKPMPPLYFEGKISDPKAVQKVYDTMLSLPTFPAAPEGTPQPCRSGYIMTYNFSFYKDDKLFKSGTMRITPCRYGLTLDLEGSYERVFNDQSIREQFLDFLIYSLGTTADKFYGAEYMERNYWE